MVVISDIIVQGVQMLLVLLMAPLLTGFVRKIGHVDLMAIRDPERLARQRGDRPQGAPDDVATMPFFTIENVAMVDADHIIVGNDNNLPFSAGRALDKADDNEFVLIEAGDLLKAE